MVSRDLHSLGFTGENDGETFAVIEYKGLKDTIYFNVNGESITGILDDGHNSTNSGIPDRYELFQSYPNPFNPTTTIKYSIPRVSFVNIRIYDILGREVKTLVNEEKLPGIYSIQFNGGNFTSGVYFYRLQAGSFVETKKFILLK
ncbi:MAG: T9SS type A sorting domain-containing protein [Ignavibacteriales bacterium]|nr:T9SS type A sorting domain-containing protein [Ignavibacteriales bacterium]